MTVQVILRLYENPSEILHGFDIQAAKVLMMAQDGIVRYYCSPSFLKSMQYNAVWIDTERQSSTYALRLIKYFCKGFSVLLTGYHSESVNNDIVTKFHHSDSKNHTLTGIKGFAMLLQLETNIVTSYYLSNRNSITWALKEFCHKCQYARTSDYMDSVCSKSNLRDFLRNAWVINEWKKCVQMLGWRWVKSAKEIPKVKWTVRDPSSQTVIGSFHPEQEKYYHQAYGINTYMGINDVVMLAL